MKRRSNRIATVLAGLVTAAVLAFLRSHGVAPLPNRSTSIDVARGARPGDLGPGVRRQIDEIVGHVDRTGAPPAGISQGGRRGGERGLFENAEGRLPARPHGYYRETDVWPRGPDGRGAERLVFGKDGDVWYSPDHYRSFVKIR